MLCSSLGVKAQVIVNAYARISSISNSSVLALTNVNVANHTFTVGGSVVIMQMQDDVIGTNTTNASTFGDLSAIGSAGRYEIKIISAVTPTSGAPTSVTLSTVLSNTYNTGSNSAVQMISFRDLGTNFTTSSNITGLAWDGNVGGVVAFNVTNTLTLNHRILADGIGFRGGAISNSADETCDNTYYRGTDANKAGKGEGIYKNTNTTFNYGRGKMLNGGGGGCQNNAGGGGGGNYTSGGDGGTGWQCTNANSGRGIGGLSLSGQISASRIFMGGGGGGGQQNNGLGTAGGNGGGIILVKANTVITNTTCGSSIMISANGQAAANSGNDGAGGGGGGGSVVLNVSTFSINSACSLTISSNGGTGGTVGNSGSHGGGGGGGQGVVIYSTAQPTTNMTTLTNNGVGGANDNTGTGTTASSGSGTSGSGIVASGSGPLPIELIEFKAEPSRDKVITRWTTAAEKSNAYFTVEKSSDGVNYLYVTTVKGSGTSNKVNAYSAYDPSPLKGISYYRLKQTDLDGKFDYSPVVSVAMDEMPELRIIPNPVDKEEKITFTLSGKIDGPVLVQINDLAGQTVYSETVTASGNTFRLENFVAKEGVYLLQLRSGDTVQTSRLLIR